MKYLEQRYQLKVRVYQRPPTSREFYEILQSTKVWPLPSFFM